MSQEWDEVVHEVVLLVTRLDALRDDLLAASASGELTSEQCEFINEITHFSGAASQSCLKLLAKATSELAKAMSENAKAMSENAKEGGTKE